MADRLPIPLERLLSGPPITGRGLFGVEWHPDGRRFTYLERRETAEEAEEAQTAEEAETPTGGDTATAATAAGAGNGPIVRDLWAYDLESGRRELLLEGDHPQLIVEGRDLPLTLDGYKWLPDRERLVLVDGDTAWLHSTVSGGTVRLCTGLDPKVGLGIDPTGGRLAFVRTGDLWVVDVDTRDEIAITDDGDGSIILNGCLPWVYWEELAMLGRNWASFSWSPDGRHLAFLRFDLTNVPIYPLVPAQRERLEPDPQRYPSPGDPNPVPSVVIAAVDQVDAVADPEGALVTNEYCAKDDAHYLGPQVAWSPDGQAVVFARMARDQRSLDVLRLPLDGGEAVTLLSERDPHWLNHIGPPVFLPDGRFLWISERTGHAHVELRSAKGKPVRDVTSGDWQVERIHGVHGGHVYVSGTGSDPRERHLYRAPVDGATSNRSAKIEQLSREPGVHDVNWAPNGGWTLTTVHTPEAPPRVMLGGGPRRDREPVEVHGPDPAWDTYAWSRAEFVDIEAADGTTLHGRLWRPPDFDATQRYPVLVWVYGGPHAQVVRKTWSANSSAELFAQAGFIVWSLDGRGSWGRGHSFESTIGLAADGRLGPVELADQLEGVAYLRSLPEVNGDRIGIAGSSYGGYMTLYALTHAPDVWACGIASAAVTNWRLYTSIYTERYLGIPGTDGKAYDESSVLAAMSDLDAPLLIVQGTDDDNVHAQHTLQVIDALTRCRKPYELLLDVGGRHGLSEPARPFVTERMIDFLLRHLGRPVQSQR